MNKLIILLSIFNLFVFSASAAVDINLLPYAKFVSEWSNYSYGGEELPQVEFTSDTLVQIFSYGDYVYAQAEFKGETLPLVNAFYDRDKKTIYISNRLKGDEVSTELALVHEVVHYLQDISGFTDSLNGFLICSESIAYDVQALWQIVNKVSLDTVSNVHQQSLVSAMSCMGGKSKAFNL